MPIPKQKHTTQKPQEQLEQIVEDIGLSDADKEKMIQGPMSREEAAAFLAANPQLPFIIRESNNPDQKNNYIFQGHDGKAYSHDKNELDQAWNFMAHSPTNPITHTTGQMLATSKEWVQNTDERQQEKAREFCNSTVKDLPDNAVDFNCSKAEAAETLKNDSTVPFILRKSETRDDIFVLSMRGDGKDEGKIINIPIEKSKFDLPKDKLNLNLEGKTVPLQSVMNRAMANRDAEQASQVVKNPEPIARESDPIVQEQESVASTFASDAQTPESVTQASESVVQTFEANAQSPEPITQASESMIQTVQANTQNPEPGVQELQTQSKDPESVIQTSESTTQAFDDLIQKIGSAASSLAGFKAIEVIGKAFDLLAEDFINSFAQEKWFTPPETKDGKTWLNFPSQEVLSEFMMGEAQAERSFTVVDPETNNVMAYSNGDGNLYDGNGKPYEQGENLRVSDTNLNNFNVSPPPPSLSSAESALSFMTPLTDSDPTGFGDLNTSLYNPSPNTDSLPSMEEASESSFRFK